MNGKNNKRGRISAWLIAVLLGMSVVCSACAPTETSTDSSGSESGNVTTVDWTDREESYTNFEGLPGDWELYEESDVSNTKTSYEGGEMSITHTNASVGESLYHGALYRIGTGYSWTDFTFEITLKMSNPANTTRWFGVMYHTQKTGSNLTGYLVNYRYSGQTAVSAVDAARSFHDDANKTSTALSDGAYHTLKIVMEGTTASHYMDDELITTWDVTEKDNCFGGSTLSEGGFGLIVNRSTVTVSACTISGKAREVQEATADETIVSTYQSPTALANAPTVVCDVTDGDVLDSLTAGERRPSNAILYLDGNANVVGRNGKKLETFANVYEYVLEKNIIPILYVSTESEAQAAITFLSEEIDILDIAVMSDDPALVKMIRTANAKVRGIVEYTEGTDLQEIVQTTNANYANVAVIPQSLATRENVTYLQARFTTVWVKAESDTVDVYDCVNSGAYGVISEDFGQVYDVLESYPEGSVTRTPFNVAHRGLPNKYHENSVSGTEAAIAAGATHVELDGQLTADGEIVMMHDATIDATTNGTGNVSGMTLEQLRQYKLDVYSPQEDIPTLREIIEVMQGTEAVLVFEIKTSDLAIVPALKEILDEYDFYDQIVVISFYTDSLIEMKVEIPEVPTANLNTASASSFESVLYWTGLYNTGIDSIYTSTSVAFNEAYLRDRGLIGWYWTYGTGEELEEAIADGYVGLTNNCGDYLSDTLRSVSGTDVTRDMIGEDETLTVAVGDAATVTLTTYSGEETQTEGKVYYVADEGEYYRVIACYEADDGTLYYTQSYTVYKSAHESNPFILVVVIVCICAVVAAGVVIWIVRRKKKSDQS